MIEVLFSENEAGALKYLKGSNDIICLNLLLDIGNIQQSFDSQYRQDLIISMYTQNGYDNTEEVITKLKEGIKQYTNEFNRLINHLESGESIRIWYSDKPYSLCGLYFLCHHLKDYNNNIYC